MRISDWSSDVCSSELIAGLNGFAAQARDAGLGFAYHNHDFEFLNRSGGKTLYDRLLDETDPALVKMELDLYWAVHAGADAAQLIDRLSTRLYAFRSEEHTSELQSLMRISYAVFCLQQKTTPTKPHTSLTSSKQPQ